VALTPKQYTELKNFRDLIKQTVDRLRQAQSQGALSQAVGDCAPRWDKVDGDFAAVLRNVGDSVWQMPFMQVRPTVNAICDHLGGQLSEIDEQLARG